MSDLKIDYKVRWSDTNKHNKNITAMRSLRFIEYTRDNRSVLYLKDVLRDWMSGKAQRALFMMR